MNPSQIIKSAGGVSRVDRALACSPQVVGNWVKRGIPVDACPAIEQLTQGVVSVESMRPDVVWVRIYDPTWPNALGRPCLDLVPMRCASQPPQASDTAEKTVSRV